MWRPAKFKLNIPEKKFYEIIDKDEVKKRSHIVITSPKLLEIAKALKKKVTELENKITTTSGLNEDLKEQIKTLQQRISTIEASKKISVDNMNTATNVTEENINQDKISSLGTFKVPSIDEVFMETKELLLNDEGQPGNPYNPS